MLPFRDYNPTRSFPVVTISLIVLNTLVFLYMLSLQSQGDEVLQHFVARSAVVPHQFLLFFHGEPTAKNVIHPVYLTIFTAMFLHGGFTHLAGNMLYLWIFGNNVEDIMGSVRYLIFYLVCGVLATVAYLITAGDSTVPALGASGAIAGVLGAYLVRFPRAQVDTCLFIIIFWTVVRLPAFIVLAGWFILQFFEGVLSLQTGVKNQGGVAFWAHIGGFIAGMVLVFFFQKRDNNPHQAWS